jgi:hypothetical protein
MSLPPNHAHGDMPINDDEHASQYQRPVSVSEVVTSSEGLARIARELDRIVGPFTA